MANSVIHKQVIDLDLVRSMAELAGPEVLTFELPVDAEMVDIQWDTRNPIGIAFWYKTEYVDSPAPGQEVKFWRFLIVGTGHPFPEEAKHHATVVRDGFAWHVLDADGDSVQWAEL